LGECNDPDKSDIIAHWEATARRRSEKKTKKVSKKHR
jgi:hypothetical protein